MAGNELKTKRPAYALILPALQPWCRNLSVFSACDTWQMKSLLLADTGITPATQVLVRCKACCRMASTARTMQLLQQVQVQLLGKLTRWLFTSMQRVTTSKSCQHCSHPKATGAHTVTHEIISCTFWLSPAQLAQSSGPGTGSAGQQQCRRHPAALLDRCFLDPRGCLHPECPGIAAHMCWAEQVS